MTPTELTSAVRARLDELERVARRAGATQPRWAYDRETFTVSSREWSIAARKYDGSPINDVDGEHIAMHDPAAVLQLVGAMRKIVVEHGPYALATDWYCSACGDVPQVTFPCATLRALADGLGIDLERILGP